MDICAMNVRMEMKERWVLLVPLLLLCFLTCQASDDKRRMPDRPDFPIVIVYENDSHCAVDGYPRLASLRAQQRMATPYVTIVSCGDFVQGEVIGSVSWGEQIVEVMNRVGYDVVALGNHEFDFGMSQIRHLTDLLDASVVSANFRDLRSGELVFPAYRMVRYGEVDIAYIGLTTPETATSVAPSTFWDQDGNHIYDFMLNEFYQQTQTCVDRARAEGADHVVLLSHLGDRKRPGYPSSFSLIAATTGVDVVLDGHDHHVIPDTLIHNKEGQPVLFSSTGAKFQYIGLLTLSTDGQFSSRLVPLADLMPDTDVQAYVDAIKGNTLTEGMRVVGTCDVDLPIVDASGEANVRSCEMPLGNFCADAFRLMLKADVAMINGGGIRSGLSQGEITFNDLLAVFPFNNTACTATLTGQQLLDALEMSVRYLPDMDGSFMQVSGMTFEVDLSVPSPVVLDEYSWFSHVSPAPRRVSHLQIWDKEQGAYVPVDTDRTYVLASFDYQLKGYGSNAVFRYATLKDDSHGLDVEVLISYLTQMLGGRIGQSYAATEGRIRIL